MHLKKKTSSENYKIMRVIKKKIVCGIRSNSITTYKNEINKINEIVSSAKNGTGNEPSADSSITIPMTSDNGFATNLPARDSYSRNNHFHLLSSPPIS